MSTVHISEEEAVKDFAAVLARVDLGADVVVGRTSGQLRLWRSGPSRPLTFAEAVNLLPKTSAGVLDGDFEKDALKFREHHRGEFLKDPWE